MNCMDLDYQFNNDSLILISQILLNYPTTIFEFLMKKMEIGESLELMIYIVEILKSTNGNVPGIVVNYEHLFELILDKDDYIHHASIFLEFQKNVNLDLKWIFFNKEFYFCRIISLDDENNFSCLVVFGQSHQCWFNRTKSCP
jgi:hypothetical protein